MLELLANWPGATALRMSPVLYPAVNAGHILGIALLVGPILALDARLLGIARQMPVQTLGPFLSGTAKLGAALAIATGLMLFTVQPANYIANPAFLAKMALLALAILNALLVDRSPAWRRAVAGDEIAAGLRWQAAASIVLWLAVLSAGRWIGFV